LSTETSLRGALERGEFVLHFQPLTSLSSGRLVGAEALIRWPQADRRLVAPSEFIPVAEETGLIVALGEWVLREACARARAWQSLRTGVRVAVNLSARQFRQRGLAATIERTLGETGLAPDLLELELTEGVLMQHSADSVSALANLEAIGVRLAIDDFGTGYSSLAYLKRFPIHAIKVDRSFVRDIRTDPDDAAIVTAIVAMARSLHLDVTAEGVENAQQASFLRSLDCDFAQGYYFGRPMPAAEFAELVAAARTLEPALERARAAA
jgi:EAL domain-containing protein (putative c-di-GMP-specific phosphodiesterase class I)